MSTSFPIPTCLSAYLPIPLPTNLFTYFLSTCDPVQSWPGVRVEHDHVSSLQLPGGLCELQLQCGGLCLRGACVHPWWVKPYVERPLTGTLHLRHRSRLPGTVFLTSRNFHPFIRCQIIKCALFLYFHEIYYLIVINIWLKLRKLWYSLLPPSQGS